MVKRREILPYLIVLYHSGKASLCFIIKFCVLQSSVHSFLSVCTTVLISVSLYIAFLCVIVCLTVVP